MTSLHAYGNTHYPVAPRENGSSGYNFRSLDDYVSAAAVRRFEAKEYIFVEGDAADQVYRVESGAVSLFKVLSDGRRQILGFAYPGDFVGLGPQGNHVMNAQVIKSARVRSISHAALHRLAAKDPDLCFTLYQTLADDLAAARELMVTTGHRSASERVASFLVALGRRGGSGKDLAKLIDLPMTRADIADFLGLTIETVSRTLTKLKVCGYIDLPQSNRAILLDTDALEGLAEGTNSL